MNNSESHEYNDAHQLFENKNYEDAFTIYKRLAKSGDPHCQTMIGWMYYKGLGTALDIEKAVGWFKIAAKLGSKEASFYCGKVALSTRQYEEALEWFRKSAAQEFGPALLWIGNMYIRGLAVEKDIDTGVQYLKRAARTGNFPARRELAVLMVQGKLGGTRVIAGLALFPYSIVAALISGFLEGYSHKLMG